MPLLAAAINLDPNPAVGGGDITVEGSALVPQEGPSGTAADIIDRPDSSQISVYTVHSNDTLSGIAKMFDVSVNTIIWANDIKGGIIHEGESLIILPINGIKHTVFKGDTLASLAKSYKSNVHDIASYNDLADDAALTVGQSIIIPNGEVAVKPTAPSPNKTKIKNLAKGKTTEPYLGGSGPALSDYFIRPIDANWSITQGLHGWNAIDFGAPKGTPIYAAAEGTVIIAKGGGGWNGGYGNYVVIQHPNGVQTLYAHASKLLVSAGDQVSQGETIAKVGTTGLSTGSHLHFEVRGAANPFAN
jgi:LysM repeat protein